MYYRHMESRSFEDQTAMREDIRRINLYIKGLKDNYTVVDRLGEGMSPYANFLVFCAADLTTSLFRHIFIRLQGDRQALSTVR
jgi:hypothetical protein